jgi:hypothetical protein
MFSKIIIAENAPRILKEISENMKAQEVLNISSNFQYSDAGDWGSILGWKCLSRGLYGATVRYIPKPCMKIDTLGKWALVC